MEFLIELLFNVIFEPFVYLVLAPLENDMSVVETRKTPIIKKVLRIALVSLLAVAVLSSFFLIVFGAVFLAIEKDEDGTPALVMLLVGIGILVAYSIVVIVRLNVKKKRNKISPCAVNPPIGPGEALGKTVHIIVDRPLGSVHPEHDDIVYAVNYGFVPGEISGDGEAQDAYIIGVDEPISEFDGAVVAVIHRLNDNEDKWVVAPHGVEITDEEIKEKTDFQERFFETEIIRCRASRLR